MSLLTATLIYTAPVAQAAVLTVPQAPITARELIDATSTIPELIERYSASYDVSGDELTATLRCESGLNPKARGDNGTSYGIAQIHLPAHPEITRNQALDPNFAIKWTAQQFSLGHQAMWTCWRTHH